MKRRHWKEKAVCADGSVGNGYKGMSGRCKIPLQRRFVVRLIGQVMRTNPT